MVNLKISAIISPSQRENMMTDIFTPKTEKIKYFAKLHSKAIEELETVFENKTNVYIDFANVLGWQDRLKWRIDLKRLKQFLDSFVNINSVKFYYGTLVGDAFSEEIAKDANKYKYDFKTKPVKIMNLSIDVSSIPKNSPVLLEGFIRKSLLLKLTLETIEYLNSKLQELNDQGIKSIEDRKCNFDVEIGRDMLIDYKDDIASFVLWSGDSDFVDPISQLLKDKKKVAVFATVRKISQELGALTKEGLFIFDIQKIRNFICWSKEIKIRKEMRKGSPSGDP